MITVRKAAQRGRTEIGWLDSRHTFSFGDYWDPAHMGYRSLRVINDDRVAPGGGFGTHPHRDMEILTYVLDGGLAHRDSLGTGSEIRPGDVQHMTAGTGIRHSEFNASRVEPVHFLQIWLEPERNGLRPGYDQKTFFAEGADGLRLVASRDGRDGSLTVHQDADLYAARLGPGGTASHSLRPGRHAWVQVARGSVVLNGTRLEEGDGAAADGEARLDLHASDGAELLLFDLA
jgi:redox-sensitive bicupin YhaK (pirin superfamily)